MANIYLILSHKEHYLYSPNKLRNLKQNQTLSI